MEAVPLPIREERRHTSIGLMFAPKVRQRQKEKCHDHHDANG
jgi:hypothetical protein